MNSKSDKFRHINAIYNPQTNNNMKYTFQIVIYWEYNDKKAEIEINLSKKDVSRIKELVSNKKDREEDLLEILYENDEALFKKFWKAAFPYVFVSLLEQGFESWYFSDELFRPTRFEVEDFQELFKMYGNSMNIEYSSCSCKIPDEFR